MMTLSTPAANLASNPYERAAAAPAVNVAAPVRADSSMDDAKASAKLAKANEAASNRAPSVDLAIPDVMRRLSMMATVNASLGSAPTTLAIMSDIAIASGSGTLSDVERAALQTQYSELSQQVVGAVGAASAGGQAGADTSRHDRDSRAGLDRQAADDRRSTLTQTGQQAPQYVHREGNEQLLATTTTRVVPDGGGQRKAPVVTLLRHELHVGSDSYEPVSVKQTQTRLSQPAESARIEQRSTTHRMVAEQVSQIRQMSETAQVAQLSVVV